MLLQPLRTKRDRLAGYALEDAREVLPAETVQQFIDDICRASDGWEEKVDWLSGACSDQWVMNGCVGIPGWQYLSELKAIVKQIAEAEKAELK